MGQSSSSSLRSSSRKAKENSTCLSGSASTSPPSPRQPTGRRSLRFLRGQRLNVVRSQTETKTAFPSSSNAQTLKPRLQTTQAPGLLRKTMQPNLQEDLFSEQQY